VNGQSLITRPQELFQQNARIIGCGNYRLWSLNDALETKKMKVIAFDPYLDPRTGPLNWAFRRSNSTNCFSALGRDHPAYALVEKHEKHRQSRNGARHGPAKASILVHCERRRSGLMRKPSKTRWEAGPFVPRRLDCFASSPTKEQPTVGTPGFIRYAASSARRPRGAGKRLLFKLLNKWRIIFLPGAFSNAINTPSYLG